MAGPGPSGAHGSDMENLLCISGPQAFSQIISYEAEKRAEHAGGLDALKRSQELIREKD
jgi:hypothetical protein